MTQNLSRRTLAKGAAWAAPAVVATATVPAYAASLACPENIDQQVDAIFRRRLTSLPSLSNTTIRLWFTNNGNSNGALGTSNLRMQVTNGGALDVSTLAFGFEFAQRNVATSPAINKLFGGGTVRSAKMPAEWPANAKWNTGTGLADTSPRALNVDNPNARNQRDVSHASSYINVYSADGRYNNLGAGEFGEETGVAEGNHLKWLFSIKPNTAATKGDAVDFVNSNWRDGTVAGSGAIYTAIGVRPVGFLPPSFDEVRSSVGSSVDEACLLEAYTKRVAIWNSSKERFAGATIQFSGWSHDTSGDTKAVTYTGSDYVYSNEIGAFQGTTSAGNAGTGFNGSTSNAITFFNAQLAGLPNGQNTQLGYQLMYADGIW